MKKEGFFYNTKSFIKTGEDFIFCVLKEVKNLIKADT